MKIEPLARLLTGFLSYFTHNSNADKIETAFVNTLSRDGSSPNQMLAPLDMGLNRIVNIGPPKDINDAVRLVDVTGSPTISISNAWTDITGKPTTFVPSAHTHPESDVTGLVTDLAGKASLSHSHTLGDITGLDAEIDSRVGTHTIRAGTNVTLSYNSGTGELTINSTSTASTAWSSLTGVPSTFTPSAHTHPESDITSLVSDLAGKANVSHSHSSSDISSFGASVGATLAAGSGISLSTVSGVTTITNTASGGVGSPPIVYSLTSHGDYRWGSLDPLGTSEPGRSFMNIGVTSMSANSVNENILTIQGQAVGAHGGTTNAKQGILVQMGTAISNTIGNFGTGAIEGAVCFYGSGFLNGGATYGSIWGGVFETSVISGSDGFQAGIEIGCYQQSASVESSSIDNIYRVKNNLWLGAGLNNSRATAGIFFAPTGATNGGWFYGGVFQNVSTSYLLFRNPSAASAVALDVRSHANWGDAMRLPETSRIARYNAANNATKNLIQWDASNNVAIGETGDVLLLYISGLGQRQIQFGASNSGGAGFRQLIVSN